MKSSLVEVRRLYNEAPSPSAQFPNAAQWYDGSDFTLQGIKDPCVVRKPDGKYFMLTSIGDSLKERWRIGRFEAEHPSGPWTELPMASVEGLDGWDICAPALYLRNGAGGLEYHMYVQNLCFHENGIIAHAVSHDGQNFKVTEGWQVSRHDMAEAGHDVVAVYDPGHSEIEYLGQRYECLTFTGIRTVGCGDLYMMMRPVADGAAWSKPEQILRQEDVPFHNRPDDKSRFEWGLEAAKLVQLAPDMYMLMAVGFLDGDLSQIGTRQRLFTALSPSPWGPFEESQLLIEPSQYDVGRGENGHGDTIDLGDRIGILFQERAGNIKAAHARKEDGDVIPEFHWHLRYAEADKHELQRVKYKSRTPEVQLG